MNCCCHDEAHDLDFGEIDDLDEICEDEQLAFIWCHRHNRHEWHSVPRCMIPGSSDYAE